MPRVLIISNFLSEKSGTHGVCEELAARLPAKGWEVETTSSVRNRPLRLLDMLRTVRRLRVSLDVAQIDIFSGLAFRWAEAITRLLAKKNVPIVMTLNGGNLPAFAKRNPARVRRLLAHANMVVAPSAYLRDALQEFCYHIQIIPNAIDVNRYSFRSRLAHAPRLVWLRAFHEIYNPALAVAVTHKLLNVYPDVHLTMIGPDKGQRRMIERALIAHDLSDHIELRGPIEKSEVPAALNDAEIFLNTSNIDNTPVSVLEAQAAGLCVVSTNVGGLPHVIDHGKTGLLAPPNDLMACAAHIHAILQNPVLANELSEGAHRRAQSFDWAAVLDRWHEVLTESASSKQ